MKEEKKERERIARAVTKRDIKYKDYDGAMMSDRLWSAGEASYVERNQDMINESDYCVFYYNPEYQPPKRKYSKRSVGDYQPKSGTKVAFEYANQVSQQVKLTIPKSKRHRRARKSHGFIGYAFVKKGVIVGSYYVKQFF